MSPTELKAPIIAEVKQLLHPLGFRKAGALFSRTSENVVHLIEVQGSRQSTSALAKFTINVGVFVPELIYPDVRDFGKPSIPEAHWRERLGSLSPEGSDLWWEVMTQAEAVAAAKDIAARLTTYALPALGGLPNIEALVMLWQSGRCPGLTDYQRKEYLATLGRTQGSGQSVG